MSNVLFIWKLFFIVVHFQIFLKCLFGSFTSVSISQRLSLMECLTEDTKKVGRCLSLPFARQSGRTRPNMDKGPSVNKRELRGVSFSGFSELPLIYFVIKVNCFCKVRCFCMWLNSYIYIFMCKINVCLLLLTFIIGMVCN